MLLFLFTLFEEHMINYCCVRFFPFFRGEKTAKIRNFSQYFRNFITFEQNYSLKTSIKCLETTILIAF